MTICFFSAQYLPTAGGVERYTYNLARRAARRGHRVAVVTSALPGLPARETGEAGVEILRLPCVPLMHGRFPLVRPNGAFRRLEKVLWTQLRPDCIVANNLFYPLSVYAVGAANRRKLPLLLINHGTQYLMVGNPVLAWLGRVYERMTAQWIARRCSRIYAVSQQGAGWLRQAFGIEAAGVIYNAVDPAELNALAADGADWRAKYGLAPDTPLVGFSGRIIPEKGADRLCAAMREIRAAVPGAVAVLAGEGALLETLRAAGYEGVFLPGVVRHADSLSLLAQCDVFCLPTRSEGFASTVLEAAALGTPIVTTPTGGSVELLPGAEYGTLLPDMAAGSVARGCIAALQNPAWRESAAKRTQERLQARFTWEKSADRLCEALRDAMQGGKHAEEGSRI